MSFDRFLREVEDEIGGHCYSVRLKLRKKEDFTSKGDVVVFNVEKDVANLIVLDSRGNVRRAEIDEKRFDEHVGYFYLFSLSQCVGITPHTCVTERKSGNRLFAGGFCDSFLSQSVRRDLHVG